MAAASPVTGIDHTIVGVADLEAARLAWHRLGFVTTPRGRHKGWGTANYCIMFERDYIEILGIIDPAQYSQGLDAFLAQYGDGLLALAYGTEDAERVQAAYAEAGIAGDGIQDLSRFLDMPEGLAEPRFKLIHPANRTALGASGFVCQHLSPEIIRRPSWLRHPNTATRIAHVSVAVTRPADVIPALDALFGADAVTPQDGGLTIDTGGATVHIGPLAPFGDRFGDRSSVILGQAVAVADLDACAAVLAAQGVRSQRTDAGLDVDPRDANGSVLSFVPEP